MMKENLNVRFSTKESPEEKRKFREAIDKALESSDSASLTNEFEFNIEKLASISQKEIVEKLSKVVSERFIFLYKEFEESVKERRDAGESIATKEFHEFLAKRKKNSSNVVEELVDLTSNEFEIIEIPRTKAATHFIVPKSKVANSLFQGFITIDGEEYTIGVEKRNSKKFIDTLVTVDFDMPNVQMSRDISLYDRIVHDAITSLFISGGNEYLTPLMIYRTMTGNPKAAPKKEQLQRVSESVLTLSRIRIIIKAEEEKEKFGLKNSSYEGNLIATEIVRGKYNGKEDEWIRLLRSPILYDYSSERSNQQISRTEIKMLNTPINKNVEKMELQYYLLQRIETIKNANAKTSNRILFERIYEVLKIEAKSSSSLRNKQAKIREATFTILDYWVENKFIKSYKKVNKAKSIIAIDIIN